MVKLRLEGAKAGATELKGALQMRARRLLVIAVAVALTGLTALVASAATRSAEKGGGWVYTLSNDPGHNAVVAVSYGKNGNLLPESTRSFPTGGKGEKFVHGGSAGTFAGDHQVTMSPDGRFLLAVNGGSNTIAVFQVNHHTGALTPVQGSPFNSGGENPISIDVSGNLVVVANHGLIPGQKPPGNGNLTSFKFSSSGRLTKISTVSAPGGPIESAISPNGRVVFSSDFFAFALQVLHMSASGKLSNGPGGVFQFPKAVTQGRQAPPVLPPPAINLPFGVGVNPNHPYVYYAAAVAERLAVYKYSNNGAMTFVKAVDNSPNLATCWLWLTPDGRFMYANNTGSKTVAAWSVSASGTTLKRLQVSPLEKYGVPTNLTLAPQGNALFTLVVHDDADVPQSKLADGNFIESYRVGKDHTLSRGDVAPLPVFFSDLPAGLIAVAKS